MIARRRRPACEDARRLVTGPFAGRLWCARKPYERIISEKSLCEAERCPFRSKIFPAPVGAWAEQQHNNGENENG